MSEVEVTQVDQEEYPEMHRVLELALEAGRILLRNGAEIFRVEETIEHICKRFGVEAVDSFVLSNGIFFDSIQQRKRELCQGEACANGRDTPWDCHGSQRFVERDLSGKSWD